MFPSHDPLTVTSAPALGPRLVFVTPLSPAPAPEVDRTGLLQLQIDGLAARLTAVEASLARPWWAPIAEAARRLWTWLNTEL